jgi:hypothetical protein
MTRGMGRALGYAVCCLLVTPAVLGCAAETSGDITEDLFSPGDVASDASNLGEVRQSLEQFVDRPAVAAVGVGTTESNNIQQMWVFACKSNNTLWRRVKPSWSSDWEAWTQVSSTPCSGVPTAGAWDATTTDPVEVFFRSTEGKLIELYFRSNGTVAEVDLSAHLGLGTINGNPVIADMGGSPSRVAVAYRDASNRLRTLSWQSATDWVIQSAVNADGWQIYADGLLTAIYTPGQTYLSSSLNGTYRVLSRTKWIRPYVGINATIPNSRGVLTFAAPTIDTALVINRNGSDRVTKSAVVAGQAWNFTLANSTVVKATPYMGYSYSYLDAGGSSGQDRGLGCQLAAGECEVTTLWGLNDTQTSTYIYAQRDLNSAGTRPVNPHSRMENYVFYAGANYRLYWANLWSENGFGGAFHDLGLTVLIP